jgi:mono/diheme cytochrome c family protein
MREPVEPEEGHRPLPLWLVTFIGVLLFWGGIYMQRYSGDYDAMVYDENASRGQATAHATVQVDPYVMGRRIYADICAKCHQPDGLGIPGQYPPLVGSDWALAPGPARIIRIVLDGLQGPITVKGEAFDNVMTPLRDTLTDRQIAAVLTYVRTHKEWGHNASPVAPEEVADIRKKTKGRPQVGSWTAVELLAIPEHEPKP